MPETRIAFTDANWLASLYYETRDSAHVRQWAESGRSTLVCSSLVVAECHRAFWRRGDRVAALESDLRARKIVIAGHTFEYLFQESRDWFRRYCPRLDVGTLDVMHVRAAELFGCEWFLSFDTRSGCRALAMARKLKVFPEPTSEDRALLRKIKAS
jgi:hypothetical protein